MSCDLSLLDVHISLLKEAGNLLGRILPVCVISKSLLNYGMFRNKIEMFSF